jgi:hypothetical protein
LLVRDDVEYNQVCKPDTIGDTAHPIILDQNNGSIDVDVHKKCGYLMEDTGLADAWLGLILLIVSLFVLCSCLVMLVKILNSMMKDKMAQVNWVEW